MKRAIYVDYENVNISGLKGIEELTHDDVVKIFIGAQASKLTMVDANRIFNCEASVELITNKYIGKNALDFIIMVHMGYDIAQGLAKSYYIISKDKGYDPAIHEMRKMSGLTVARREDIVAVLDEKKSFGRRIKGVLGIGKVKESPDTTEHTVVGKGKKDSNEFSRITKDYVKEEDSKKGKKKDKNSRTNKTKEKPVKENKVEEKKPSRESKSEEKKPDKGRKNEQKKIVKERKTEEKKPVENRQDRKKKNVEVSQKETGKNAENPVEQVETINDSIVVEKQENRQSEKNNHRNNNYSYRNNNRYNNRNRRPKTENKDEIQVEKMVEHQVKNVKTVVTEAEEKVQPDVEERIQPEVKEKAQTRVQESVRSEVQDKVQTKVQERVRSEVQDKVQTKVQDKVHPEVKNGVQDMPVKESSNEGQSQPVEQVEEKKTGSGGNYHRNYHGRGRGHYNNHRSYNKNSYSYNEEKKVEAAPVVKTPEEVERERQRNEAFALLAELDKQESQSTQFSYKKFK